MKDDLANVSSTPATSSAALPPSTAPAFPLPAANARTPQKVVMTPPASARHTSKKWLLPVIAVLVLVIVGGSGWFFLTVYKTAAPASKTAATVASSVQMLPKGASVIIGYNLSNPQDRQAVQTAWQNTGAGQAGVADLLRGNPSVLAGIQNVNELYVVTLPGDPQAYVVTPDISEVTTLLTGSQAKYLSQNGWLIIAATNPQAYANALTAGSLDGSSSAFLFTPDQAGPVKILVQGSALGSISKDTALKNSLASTTPMRLVGQFTNSSLILSGNTGNAPQAGTIATSVQQSLFTSIPSDVQSVIMGGNFAADIATLNQAPDSTSSAQPAAASLLHQLNGSYAYYTREGQDKLRDWAAIIQVPAGLKDSLKIGDPSLEASLQSLVLSVTGLPVASQLAFADVNYQNVPLRYVNLGSSSQAIDYTIAGGYIAVATSKEGIFSLIDVLQNQALSFEAAGSWQALLSQWGSLPASSLFMFSALQDQALIQLLPHNSNLAAIPFGIGWDGNSSDGKVQAVIQLNK
jgi:hypothetical protein